ncbi:MAG: hypothetical protein EA383_16395 [Spirochaetaceae bacterium]|nr:MAG: hypothetical protein EA383_16395 [Spirochaetaceae bacterium]
MDKIFDRLTDLLRSMGGSSSADPFSYTSDEDLRDAFEELEDYMQTGSTSGTGTRFRGSSASDRHARTPNAMPESLRKDFANLDIPFGASIEQARAAHRKLMVSYHPDRHAADPDKQRIATEITQRVNNSFQRIRQFYERGEIPS